MSQKVRYQYEKVRQNRFPTRLFVVFFGSLLLVSGLHIGLIVVMNKLSLFEGIQTLLAMGYWGLVAAGLTWYSRKQIQRVYETPMQNLADATTQVANGDFSVYVPTIHTADDYDYLDIMILDFNRMVEELGSIETLKTDFVSNVSHEMKTPIAVMKNYAELLRSDHLTDAQRKEYAEIIEDAADKLSHLITNILRLNKLEHQRITADVRVYDVTRQLYDCILQFELVLDEKELELDVDLADRMYVYADESLMELVWNNLLSNAMKFTEPGGTIRVAQSVQDGFVRIAISDTGCGMNEAQVKHIFDKFYQGDTSHSGEGNGLGLALVKRVIELLDGEIQVESKEGEGSTFTVMLPVAKTKQGLEETPYEADRVV